jgi:type VI secretion system secreted protein Hcp
MCTASPKLAISCASGEHIKDATLVCRKSGKTPQEYLIFKFFDLLVSSYQTGYSQGQDEAFDSCSMSYGKLEWSYKPQKADGSLDAALDFKYDLKTNVAS